MTKVDSSQRRGSSVSRRGSLNASLDPSNNSSVNELARTLDLCSAARTIRRNCASTDQEPDHVLDSVLSRNISKRLNSLDIVSQAIENSVAGIQPSATLGQAIEKPVHSSTPADSPPTNPRRKIVPSLSFSSTSPSSSINGEVFHKQIPPVVTMEASITEAKRQLGRLEFLIDDFGPEDVDSLTIKTYESKLNTIGETHMVMHLEIREALINFEANLSAAQVQMLQKMQTDTKAKVRNHRNRIKDKVKQVLDADPTSDNEAAKIALLKRQVEVAEKAHENTIAAQNSSKIDTNKEENEKKNAVIVKATAKYGQVEEDIDKLKQEVNTVNEWTEASDIQINRGMRNISSWKKTMREVVSLNRELYNLCIEHNITVVEVNYLQMDQALSDFQMQFDRICKAIEKEDDDRALYTLDLAKTDLVKLPTFSGKEDQDFIKFKDEILKGFVTNRVSKADQLAKLRTCLSGHALNLVPQSTVTQIETAWIVLNTAFGNPTRLLKYKREELLKVGPMPGENQKGGLRSQVEWFMKIENLLRGIIDLGNRDEDLKYECFNPSSINTVIELFPTRIKQKLIKVPGRRDEKLEAILAKISELRVDTMNLQQVSELSLSNTTKPHDSGGSGVGSGRSSNRGRGVQAGAAVLRGYAAYNPPQRDPKCRICTTLEAHGETDSLYDNHIHSYPSGCPRYVKMSVEERASICAQAKLCLKCHHPEYIWKRNDPTHKCSMFGKKTRFSCTNQTCQFHLWACVRHKDENNKQLIKFKEEYQRKFSLDFGLVINVNNAIKLQYNNQSGKQARTPNAAHGIHAAANGSSPRKSSTGKGSKNKSKKVSFEEEKKSNPEKNLESEIHDHGPIISTEEATETLKRKLSEDGEEVELKSVPKGRSIFIMAETKGITRPVQILYDTGCTGMLLREGVQHELGKSVRTMKGPFMVKGVGNSEVKVNDQWQSSLHLTNGSRQAIEGFAVDEVTAPLPSIAVTRAVEEIKASDKANTQLQKLKVQKMIGGNCDILLGMQYYSVFPKEVHALENGLTIFEVQVVPHDPTITACIGGPHETFEAMANTCGSPGILFTQIQQQLENYRNFGPPKVSTCIMSQEDTGFAEVHQNWDMGEDFERFIEEFNEIKASRDDIGEVFVAPENNLDLNSSNASITEIPKCHDYITCSGCGADLNEDYLDINLPSLTTSTDSEDEGLVALRKLMQAQQEGLTIEYRCPKCRSCSSCKRSFETERVSLREEAEDMQVFDSVHIDWENKRIICSLPVRGKEEEFLSNNRIIALKILNQQCKKYYKDEETKETIVKAFNKLLKNNQMIYWKDLSNEQKALIESKPVSHWIPWRVVFKPSLSTPARPVFDASTNTPLTPDGKGGRCLNDLVVKGRVVTLNLLKLVQRWQTGCFALQGDLKQFYASIKLVTNQWNLQRILFRENLDPNGEVLEAVIQTLIWGVKCVSAQSECSIAKIAEFVKEKNPRLYDLLINCRFVDDLGSSYDNIKTVEKVTKDADALFDQVGLACKGWTISGTAPNPDIAEKGNCVSIGGLKWVSQLDLVEVPIPALHFGKKMRGRLSIGTEVFEGSCLSDMEKFVPKEITRTQAFSKHASVFDILGKLAPITAGMKLDLRRTVQKTIGWDDPMPNDLRNKWVENFWRLERLRGLKCARARMPEDAISPEMNIITAVDTAEEVKVLCSYGRFKLKSGKYSCQLLMGRSLLSDDTIPKSELEALTLGSNLNWILKTMLADWIQSDILIGDSTIALCWTISEDKKLSLFHRNRAVQIRRGTDLDSLFHVRTEFNPADLGTRPHLVKDEDVGPNSQWENGLPWMKEEIEDAIEKGILTPAKNISVSGEEEEKFNKGFVFEKTQEILTKGHFAALAATNIDKVVERAKFSNYPFPLNKFPFEKNVRIIAIIRKWRTQIPSFTEKKTSKFNMFQVNESTHTPQTRNEAHGFHAAADLSFNALNEKLEFKLLESYNPDTIVKYHSKEKFEKRQNFYQGKEAYMGFGCNKPYMVFKGKHFVGLSKSDISWALEFLYKKGTEEVKKFNKPEFVKKITIERDGVLFSKSRILEGQRLQLAGGLEDLKIIPEAQLNMMTPVLDRHSPLSYNIADYIHRVAANHAGYENCLRESLNHCFIIQGMSLFRQMGEDCTKCLKARKQYLKIIQGPIPDQNLVLAPAFYICMCDIYGPCKIFVPGHSMDTRGRKPIDVKAYIFVFVCPITKSVNLQVTESKSADGVVDALTRLGCEVGFPSFMFVDQESSILKALAEAEVDILDMDFFLHKQKGVRFKTCPVSGHNFHGLVERKIKTVQEILEKCEIANMRLHATGLQTYAKAVENEMNNLPLGYSYSRDDNNSPLFKLIYPNMLRMGRNNRRALDGIVKMPSSPKDLMEKVNKAYTVFYKLWNTTMIPKLMKYTKWHDEEDATLKIDDIVFFQKKESELSSRWSIGKIKEVIHSKDGVVRRVIVQYQNASEEEPRETDRAARSLIKLFNIDDTTWKKDMDEVEKILAEVNKEIENPPKKPTKYDKTLKLVDAAQFGQSALFADSKVVRKCNSCCCKFHCSYTEHKSTDASPEVLKMIGLDNNCPKEMFDASFANLEQYEEELLATLMINSDTVMSALSSLHTDFSLDSPCTNVYGFSG